MIPEIALLSVWLITPCSPLSNYQAHFLEFPFVFRSLVAVLLPLTLVGSFCCEAQLFRQGSHPASYLVPTSMTLIDHLNPEITE